MRYVSGVIIHAINLAPSVPVCLHCGELGPDGALFCTKCGYTLPQADAGSGTVPSTRSGRGASPPAGETAHGAASNRPLPADSASNGVPQRPQSAIPGAVGADPATAEREVLRPMPNDHRPGGGVLPRMPATATVRRGGRRGRRTGAMVRIARERVSALFGLAEKEASSGHSELADRYVGLARRIGMRYNVRLLTEYRELYCRGCSTFWVEGRTVRTRLRGGPRVRTCLKCGRERRTMLRPPASAPPPPEWEGPNAARREEGALAVPSPEEEIEDLSDEETEEP